MCWKKVLINYIIVLWPLIWPLLAMTYWRAVTLDLFIGQVEDDD